MKINASILLLVVSWLVFGSNVFAQPHVPLPIGSEAELRIFAVSEVAKGTLLLEGVNPQDHQTMVHVTVYGDGAEDVLRQLRQVELRYKVGNTNDPITAHLWLDDEKGNTLFYGSHTYTEVEVRANTKPSLLLWMQNIPLPTTGVVSAEVRALHDDGRTSSERYQQTVRNGTPFLQPWLTGRPNGQLVLTLEDGSQIFYDLSNPVPIIPSLLRTRITEMVISSHHEFEPHNGAGFNVTIREVTSDPTLYIPLKSGQYIYFDVQGYVEMDGRKFWERPLAVDILNKDGVRVAGQLFRDEGPQGVQFPPEIAGEFRFFFTWLNFQKPGRLYTGPENPVPPKKG